MQNWCSVWSVFKIECHSLTQTAKGSNIFCKYLNTDTCRSATFSTTVLYYGLIYYILPYSLHPWKNFFLAVNDETMWQFLFQGSSFVRKGIGMNRPSVVGNIKWKLFSVGLWNDCYESAFVTDHLKITLSIVYLPHGFDFKYVLPHGFIFLSDMRQL